MDKCVCPYLKINEVVTKFKKTQQNGFSWLHVLWEPTMW